MASAKPLQLQSCLRKADDRIEMDVPDEALTLAPDDEAHVTSSKLLVRTSFVPFLFIARAPESWRVRDDAAQGRAMLLVLTSTTPGEMSDLAGVANWKRCAPAACPLRSSPRCSAV